MAGMKRRLLPIVFALFLGVAMCVSAIPVIAKTLVDMRLLHRDIGQLILASSTIDDAFGWLMLAVVSALATTGLAGTDVAIAVGNLVLVVAFACTIGRFLVRRAMRLAYRSGEPVAAVAVPVILILLSAAGTHALRLEPVVGAFLCGIVIGSCRDVDRGWTQPLNAVVLSVLAPIFFATAGLRMDLTALLRPDVALAGLAVVALAIVGKFLGAWIGALISGLTRWEALALGGGMNARGVIEVIIAMAGVRLGLLSTEMYTIIVLVAVVTSVMAPPVLRFAMNRVEQNASEHLRERDLFPTSPGDRTAVGSTATAAD